MRVYLCLGIWLDCLRNRISKICMSLSVYRSIQLRCLDLAIYRLISLYISLYRYIYISAAKGISHNRRPLLTRNQLEITMIRSKSWRDDGADGDDAGKVQAVCKLIRKIIVKEARLSQIGLDLGRVVDRKKNTLNLSRTSLAWDLNYTEMYGTTFP